MHVKPQGASGEQTIGIEPRLASAKLGNDTPGYFQESAMFKHILVPTDGSELSEQVIPKAVALAKSMSARLTGLTVSDPFHVFAANPEMVTDTEACPRSFWAARPSRS